MGLLRCQTRERKASNCELRRGLKAPFAVSSSVWMVNWVVRKPRLTPAKSRLISGPFLMKIAIAVALVFAVFVWDASLNDGAWTHQASGR